MGKKSRRKGSATTNTSATKKSSPQITKLCEDCNKLLVKEQFIKQEWQATSFRRCKDCDEKNKAFEKQLCICNSPKYIDEDAARGKLLELSDDDNDVSCWLCLDKYDDDGHPIVRFCSCRGNSGWSHTSCLVKYARTKSWENMEKDNIINPDQMYRPWEDCPNCNQGYLSGLRGDLATEYVKFVEELLLGDLRSCLSINIKIWLHLEALVHKMGAVEHLELKHGEEGVHLANRILSILDQMKSRTTEISKDEEEVSCFPEMRRKQLEAAAYKGLAEFAIDEGTKEGAMAAIKYFEKAQKLHTLCGDSDVVVDVQTSIDDIKRSHLAVNEDGERKLKAPISEEHLMNLRQVYEIHEKKGVHSSSAISAGIHLAEGLQDSNHAVEAQRLIIKLYKVSKQVLGPEHHMTQWAGRIVAEVKYHEVTLGTMFARHEYMLLGYKEETNQYLIHGPIHSTWMTKEGEETPPSKEEEKLYVDINDFMLDSGTPVIVHGLPHPHDHLNGQIADIIAFKIGDIFVKWNASGYAVRFEDESLGTFDVSPDNIRILFDLPE